MVNYPNRKSPRLKEYDYTTPNYYFVTICTHQKEKLFGEPERLNHFGEIAKNGFLQISEHFPNTEIDKYVVMPNHVHAIIVLKTTETKLSTIVGSYKSFVTRNIHMLQPKRCVWQVSFHDHIIRNQKSYEIIWNYIDTNPIKWKDDCFFV